MKDSTAKKRSVLQSALQAIPCDNLDTLVKVCDALKSTSLRTAWMDDAFARELLEEWATDYRRDLDHYWKRAKRSGARIKEIYDMAIDHGWEEPETPCDVVKIRVQMSDPRLFYATIRDAEEHGEVVLRAEDCNSKQKFTGQVLNRVCRKVRYPTDEQWERLYDEAETIEADDSSTVLGQFHVQLAKFCDEHKKEDRSALRNEYDPEMAVWYDEKKGRTWFRSADLITWLKSERQFFGDQANIFALLRSLGGGYDKLHIGVLIRTGEQIKRHLWYAPINPWEMTIQLDPLEVTYEFEDAEADRIAELRKYHATKEK